MNHTICPHCSAELKPGAKACPACGSDEQTGWSQVGHIDEEWDQEDYEELRQREFGTPTSHKKKFPWVAIVAVILLAIWVRSFL